MSDRYEVSKLKFGEICVIDTTKEDSDDDKVLVSVDTEVKARIIVDLLNEKEDLIDEKPLDLHKDFSEYDECINSIDTDSKRLLEIEEEYKSESDRILKEARETEVDFKALYGGNNASTRKQYVDEQLYDLIEEKNDLKFKVDDNLRRIAFLKRMIDMKIKLIGV